MKQCQQAAASREDCQGRKERGVIVPQIGVQAREILKLLMISESDISILHQFVSIWHWVLGV